MSFSQGTSVGIKGIGGYLHLRQSDKKGDQQSTFVVNKERHQNNLRELLTKKFFNKYGLNTLGQGNTS